MVLSGNVGQEIPSLYSLSASLQLTSIFHKGAYTLIGALKYVTAARGISLDCLAPGASGSYACGLTVLFTFLFFKLLP